MKIALVCPYNMFERAGGVHQVVINLAEGLRSRGHTVKIITPRPVGYKHKPPKDFILLGRSRKIHVVGTAGDFGIELVGDEIDAVLQDEKFDVINFHEVWTPMLGRQIVTRSSEAHVGTFHANLHDSLAAKSMVNMFEPYGWGLALKMHVFTAPSPAAAAVLLNKAPDEELVKNIRYIPNGINLKHYKPVKSRQPLSGPNTKTIVYVGRLDKRKGVELLIKAFALLKQTMPEAHLIIAGEGNRRSKLEQLVQTLDVKDVKFAGFVSDEKKINLMGNADVVCSPAMYGESFGIVLVEAMAMGTPLIAGNNSGYASVLSGHGKLGLVDAESTLDFANRLEIFLTDDTIRKMLSAWGLKEAKKYDYTRVVEQYEQAYNEALKKVIAARAAESKADAKAKKKFINRVFVRRHAR